MHELSIALSIVDIASEEAQKHEGSRVIAVHLRLGPLSGVIKGALVSAYEMAREGSAVESSSLAIEDTPLVIECPKCEGPRPAVSPQQLCCAQCGSPAAGIVSGKEMEVVALELET
jgi:hydrogenase nickel incorporation protein HypA/HybF